MIKGKQTAALQTSAHCMMAETGNHQNAVETDVKWPLIQAVNNHDKSEVERLINDEGVDVNEADAQGNTALLCAVQSNVDLDIIEVLVEKGGANVNARERYTQRTSLFYAVTKSTKTASYLFENKDCFFNDSVVSSILSFFIESLCTKRHDSHPTIDEVLPLLQAKGLTPEVFAKSIVNILLCKIPLLLTSAIDGHRPRNSQHPMFHLHRKRKSFLDILKDVSGCDYLENYQRKESIKEVLEMIEYKRNISDILHLLKEHGPDPNFADSDGNTALHYATCLPWICIPQDTDVKAICEELQSFGVPLNKKNHLYETPLLFCLSGSIAHLEDDVKSTAMKTLVEVCNFLVTRGSSLNETPQNGESVFHLVIKLFQQGFKIPDQRVREGVIDETMNILHLFQRPNVGNVARESDGNHHNSPLHLWASLVLTTPVQDYTRVTREHSFEILLEVILRHLLECGALKNGRNKKEETPLHLCNTWSAVKLLIHNGANTNDKDSLKRPPLLVAASKQTFRNPSKEKNRFYPDVQEEAGPFFRAAIEKKLDPWAVDKCHKSVLGFLIAFDIYDLSKALIEVACSLKEKEIFVSLLKAICKDESLHTHWKVELVEKVLSCAKERNINVVNEAFDVCCETISQLSGMVDDEPPRSNDETFEAESDGMVDEPTTSNHETAEESNGIVDGPPTSNNGSVLKNSEIENTPHCMIAKMLRSHGAELSGKSYETLKTKCNQIEKILGDIQVEVLLPWTSRSKTHKNTLDKVAKCQEYQEIGESICCHKDPAAGSFGADVFVGINKLNSKEVAIRRIGETQCKQELKNLYAHLDCEQVIRYLLHLEDNDADLYIVFELMEGNLDDYFNDTAAFDPKKGTSLCGDIVKGLNYLHEHNYISHFQDHLKPTSIFYKTHPELCLKITDFDHSRPETSTYVCLSPEVLTNPENHSNSSDMFSCGLLLHYILSKGKHPFCPADCTNKSETDIVSETERNIIENDREIENSLSPPEAADLSEWMLENVSSRRPTGEEVLNHPLFWSKTKKMDFLAAVGNQTEFEYPRAGRSVVLSAVESALEAQFSTIVENADWNVPSYAHMPDIYNKMERRRRYKTNSVVELVRLMRNAHAHVTELPKPIQDQLLKHFVFLGHFPNLVMEVYKAVTTHGWHKTKEEIKYAMKK